MDLERASLIDVADFIEKQRPEERVHIFNTLSKERGVSVFEYLPFRLQKQILLSLSSERIADLLNLMSPDDRTAFLEELPQDLMQLLLKYLSPKERDLATKLLGYRENSVGRLMTPDYIAIKMDWTVQEVLEYIRSHGRDSETLNVVYAVDDQGILIDDFRIQEFLLASPNQKVEQLADHKALSLQVTDDEETAVSLFRKYDRVALPVIDAKGTLLGIVTLDDIIRIAIQEDTEDIQKMGGVEALNEPYIDIPLKSLLRKRVGWLTILFIGEMFTATALAFFENEIAKAAVLALFLPLIISSGGNAGSQATTLIIRAMALGEISLKDWWRVLRREVFSGLFLGGILGFIGFFRVVLWGTLFHTYGEHWLLLAITVFLALIGVVLWGTLSGSMLPILLKRCGLDPAVSSAPFVATLVDVTGVVIYFSIALVILQGTLLH